MDDSSADSSSGSSHPLSSNAREQQFQDDDTNYAYSSPYTQRSSYSGSYSHDQQATYTSSHNQYDTHLESQPYEQAASTLASYNPATSISSRSNQSRSGNTADTYRHIRVVHDGYDYDVLDRCKSNHAWIVASR